MGIINHSNFINVQRGIIMSKVRKLKRQQVKRKNSPEKGRSVLVWMIVMAVILIAVVAFLGFRNVSNAPTPESVSEGNQIETNDKESRS